MNNFKVGDDVEITDDYFNGQIGIIEEIELFEGDLEFWVRIDGNLRLFHEGEFKKADDV